MSPITVYPQPRKPEAPKAPPLVQRCEERQALRLRLAIQGALYSGFFFLGHLTTAYGVNIYAFLAFGVALVVVGNQQITQAIGNANTMPSWKRFLTHVGVPTWTPLFVYVIGAIVG